MAISSDRQRHWLTSTPSGSGIHKHCRRLALAGLASLVVMFGQAPAASAATPSGETAVITAGTSPAVPGGKIALNRPPVAIENCRGNAVWPACLYGLTPQHLGTAGEPATTGSLQSSSDRVLTMTLLLVAMLGSISLAFVFFRHLRASVEPEAPRPRRRRIR